MAGESGEAGLVVDSFRGWGAEARVEAVEQPGQGRAVAALQRGRV
jgi:hypothetical protein